MDSDANGLYKPQKKILYKVVGESQGLDATDIGYINEYMQSLLTVITERHPEPPHEMKWYIFAEGSKMSPVFMDLLLIEIYL